MMAGSLSDLNSEESPFLSIISSNTFLATTIAAFLLVENVSIQPKKLSTELGGIYDLPWCQFEAFVLKY